MATSTLTPDSDNRAQQHYDDEFNKIVNGPSLKDAENTTPSYKSNANGKSKGLSPGSIGDAEAKGNNTAIPGADYFKQKNDAKNGKQKVSLSQRLKNKVLRRWLIGALISMAIGGGGFTVFTILSGPAEFIHFAKLLEEFHLKDDQDFMDERAGKLIMNAKKRPNSTDGQEKHNLNWAGNWIALHFEQKLIDAGITPQYNEGRIRAIDIDLTSAKGRAAYNSIKEKGLKSAALKEAADGKSVRVDFSVQLGSARDRRYAVRMLVSSLGMNKLPSAIASRSLITLAGVDFHPLKNVERAANEKLSDMYTRWSESRAKSIKNGVSPAITAASANGDAQGEGAEGTNGSAQDAAGAANEISGIAGDTTLTKAERLGKVQDVLGKGAGPTAFLGLVCGVKAIGDEVGKIRYANIILPLMRMGMLVVTTGYQIMDGKDVNADELGAAKQYLNDPATKTSWSDARSIQAELGQKQTGPDVPDSAKPGSAKKPAFFRTVDDFLAYVPGSATVCSAVNSTAGGIILSAIGIAGSATPIGFVTAIISEGAQEGAFRLFLPMLIDWIAGDMVDVNAKGAVMGGMSNFGVKLAGNKTAQTHGGRPMSKQEEFELVAERKLQEGNIRENQNFYARYLDINNTKSIAAKVLFETPTFNSPNNFVAALTRLPGNVVSSAVSPLSLLGGNASAATNDEGYDYGFPQVGYSLGERNDPRFADPYANADIVEPQLAELNEKYSDCFLAQIDPTTFAISYQQPTEYDEDDPACAATDNEELLRFRFYLADMIVAKTIGCYEGIDEGACTELGIGAVPPDSELTEGDIDPSNNIDIANINEASDSIKCANGTKDLGVRDARRGEETVKIRLCAIPDLPCDGQECKPGGKYSVEGADNHAIVNSRTSLAWLNLVKEAKADGLQMYANSVYRTFEHQKDLYADYLAGRGNLAAKPGYSNHEMGNAIDFGNAGFNRIQDGDKWNKWLNANAIDFGIKGEISSEPWHWSPTGK